MIRFKSLKLGVLFLAIFLISLGFISTAALKPVNAQVRLLGGNSCVPNYSECAPGFINLAEALESGEINVVRGTQNFSNAKILKDIQSYLDKTEFGESVNQICISQQKLNWIIIEHSDFDELTAGNRAIGIDRATDLLGREFSHIGIGICGSDSEVSIAPKSGGYTNLGACCPVGFQYVTPDELGPGAFVTQYQQLGACCNTNGSSPGSLDYPYSAFSVDRGNSTSILQCKNINDDELPSDDAIPAGKLSNIAGSILNVPSSFTSVIPAKEATSVCPSTSDCAVFDIAGGAIVGSALDLDGNDQDGTDIQLMLTANISGSNSNISCSKCFNSGDPVAIKDGKLIICDPSSANGLYKAQDLINNSVPDTLAYLATSPENQGNLASCREQGGIYIAIGCVDPTPIGIITGLIRIALGVVGGVALIQLILAGFAYQSGNEEKIKEAKSRVFGTIGGLAVLVFSILILRIIGVNILDIVPEGVF